MSTLTVLRCDCCGATSAPEPNGTRSHLGWFHRWERSPGGLGERYRDYCPACHESCAVAGRCVRAEKARAR